MFLLAFAFVALTDALCMILPHKYGSLKRLIDREQLTGNTGMTQGNGSERKNGKREE
ncbi:unknown [Clostridium sp. CAG:448]|nr:unknown [Clostridium sp. CAG:448]